MSSEVLGMLLETTKRIVMDESIDDNRRLKALLEELYWVKRLSTAKAAEKLKVNRTTLRNTMKRLNVRTRDVKTATRLASTGRYKHFKCDFNGSDAEKLKLWFLAHTDASVRPDGQQVRVMLGTPDPYLAFLFKELFARYGHVGATSYRDSKGHYLWLLWILLPLKSFAWLLEKRVPAPIDEDKLYEALSVAIDAEGTIYAWKQTRTTEFKVAFYNEKEYVITPLQQALTQLGYNPRLSKVPKGRKTSFGSYNSDYYSFSIRSKANIKRLLEHIKLALPRKRLKAALIKYALSDPKEPVYWEDIERMYAEVNAINDEMLVKSKSLAKTLYARKRELNELLKSKRITWRQYEEGRIKLEDEAWKALEKLKEQYDKRFEELEERIKARSRARRPKTDLNINTTWSLVFQIFH